MPKSRSTNSAVSRSRSSRSTFQVMDPSGGNVRRAVESAPAFNPVPHAVFVPAEQARHDRIAGHPAGFLVNILNAKEPEGLSKRVENTMSKNERKDIPPPEPEIKRAKCKTGGTGHQGTMDALIVGVAISEEC